MIRNINLNWFKINKKVKLIAATIAVAIGLAGCGITSYNTQKFNQSEYNSTSSVISYIDDSNYEIDINYSNWDTEVQKQEVISISDNNGTVYRSLGIKDNGTTSTNIRDTSGKIYSYVLHKNVDIPKIDEEHKVVVNIDYYTKSMNTEVVNLEKTK